VSYATECDAATRTSRLKDLCRRHDLDWRGVARLTNRRRSTVRNWLNGCAPVPVDTLRLLELILDGEGGDA